MKIQVAIPWRDSGCRYRQAAFGWVQRRWWQFASSSAHEWLPPYVGTCGSERWSIAEALNDCLRYSRGDVVLLMGADTALNWPVVERSIEAAATGQWVLPSSSLRRLDAGASARLIAGDPHEWLDAETLTGEWQHALTLGWGPVIGPRSALLEVGYDEHFVGWGGEDEAFVTAASTLLGTPVRLDGSCFMLWHPAPAIDTSQYYANLARLALYRDAAGVAESLRRLVPGQCSFQYASGRCVLPRVHEQEPHCVPS